MIAAQRPRDSQELAEVVRGGEEHVPIAFQGRFAWDQVRVDLDGRVVLVVFGGGEDLSVACRQLVPAHERVRDHEQHGQNQDDGHPTPEILMFLAEYQFYSCLLSTFL